MQATTITLAVDAENTGSTTNEVYDRYEEFQNRSSYIGVDYLPERRNLMALYRTFPTKSGNFKGVSKSAIKFTQDVEVSGVDSSTTLTAPIIIEVSCSIPVGAMLADIKHIRQRALAALDNDSFMEKLTVQLQV